MPQSTLLPVSDIKFRDDLYPRISTSPATVQQYADDVDVLPPIEVNQHNELIDGWHRWTAHKKKTVEMISVIVTETEDDDDLIGVAIERNAAGNDRLTSKDKQKLARDLYRAFRRTDDDGEPILIPVPLTSVGARKDWLAARLKVARRTIDTWTSNIDKDRRIQIRENIIRHWLACWTVAEMEDAGFAKNRIIREWIDDFRKNRNAAILAKGGNIESLSDDFREESADYEGEAWPAYNVWTKGSKSNAVSHAGNTEAEWLDRLVWGYTEPFDIVLDPFGGGGSTIDVCRKRLRRFLVSDINPIVERENEIRKHDVTEGPLKPPQWKDVRLVYLDPPYWIQQEYGNGPTDLSSMDADAFHDALESVIKSYAATVPAGCKIALIIQPTQWKAPGRRFTDHTAEMIKRIKMPIVQRIQAPYQSEQCLPQMVNWAKENREWLVLSREITVWEAE